MGQEKKMGEVKLYFFLILFTWLRGGFFFKGWMTGSHLSAQGSTLVKGEEVVVVV